MQKKVVYTVITGDYDKLFDPLVYTPGWDYVCLTDGYLQSDGWDVQVVPTNFSSRITSRYLKMLPHRFFPDYAVSLYIDGNMHVVKKLYWFDQYVSNSLSLFHHHQINRDGRDCIYEEAVVAEKVGRCKPGELDEQLKKYRILGYPVNNGLYLGNVILRAHTDPAVVFCMEDWFTEFLAFPFRDQVSLPYVLWRNGFVPSIMNGRIRVETGIKWKPHD